MKQRFEVERFADQMEQRLSENDYKGGWQDCRYGVLFGRLIEECYELMSAVLNGSPVEGVVSEAADVANFAMMIADNKSRESRRQETIDAVDRVSP